MRTPKPPAVPDLPYSVTYSPEVEEEVRSACTSGYGTSPQLRVDVAGVFFGSHDGKQVHITGVKVFPGVATPAPLARFFEETIEEAGSNSVGWFRSSLVEISFSGADQQIHQTFFPKPWQTLLVLKPQKVADALTFRAAFFFPNCDGAIRLGRQHEFQLSAAPAQLVLTELTPAPAEDVPPASPAAVEPEPVISEPVIPEAEIEDAPVAVRVRKLEPEEVVGEPEEEAVPPPAEEVVTMPAAAAPPEEAVPGTEWDEVEPVEPKGISRRRLILIGGVAGGLLLGGSAAVYVKRNSSPPPVVNSAAKSTEAESSTPATANAAVPCAAPAPASIRLVTIEEAGQLQILWDPTLPMVQQSLGGKLIVHDGEESRTFPLELVQLRTGSFTYRRENERVDVVLTIAQRDGHDLVQATTYYAGRKRGGGEAKPNDEVERLRAELAAERQRTERLQKILARPRRGKEE